MDDIKEKKDELRLNISKILKSLSETDLSEKTKRIENRLFEFANFLESKVVLLYLNRPNEVNTREIIQRAYKYHKIVALPSFDVFKHEITIHKVDNPDTGLIPGWRGVQEPDPSRCKLIPVDFIDIAIIPGIAFDEKGGRIGSGDGFYDRLITKLPITTRKVSLALENQIVQQVPMENSDRHVDIIITEDRIIYKI